MSDKNNISKNNISKNNISKNNISKNSEDKIFISYARKDEELMHEVVDNYIKPKAEELGFNIWYDRDIPAGEDWQAKIDNELSKAKVVCFFISEDFISSKPCMHELETVLEMQKSNHTKILPIKLSSCSLTGYPKITKMNIIPDDKPWTQRDKYGKQIAGEQIESKLGQLTNICEASGPISINKAFEKELEDIGMLEGVLDQTIHLKLSDIFLDVNLKKSNIEDDYSDGTSKERWDKLTNYSNIVISGGDSSGKTSLAMQLFKKFFVKGFFPVYIKVNDKDALAGDIKNRISDNLRKQYVTNGMDIDERKVIPIIDDFHFAKDKKKHITVIQNNYERSIIFLDSVDKLTPDIRKLFYSYSNFSIPQLIYSERVSLIKKAILVLNENNVGMGSLFPRDDFNYAKLDKYVELVQMFIGKRIADYILPPYPGYILSMIMMTLNLSSNVDSKITSLGNYYQALIYCCFRKIGVSDEDYDSYNNFLKKLAFSIYGELKSSKKKSISETQYQSFVSNYRKQFNLSPDIIKLTSNLIKATIIDKSYSTSGEVSYSFKVDYIFYFFVANYISDNFGDKEIEETTDDLVKNLYRKEYAYILIFISHHYRKDDLLNKLTKLLDNMFKESECATLSRKEVGDIDKNAKELIDDPSIKIDKKITDTEKNRMAKAREIDAKEKLEEEQGYGDDENDSKTLRDIKMSLKAVEVIGHIMKNRSGSIKKDKLKEMFEKGANNHARITTYLLPDIKKFGRFVYETEKAKAKEKDEYSVISSDKLKNIVFQAMTTEFLMISFSTVWRVTDSLVNDKLISIVTDAYKKNNTPLNFLIYYHAHLKYLKKLPERSLVKKKMNNDKDFPVIAKKIARIIFSIHVEEHDMNNKDIIEHAGMLGMDIKKMMQNRATDNSKIKGELPKPNNKK